MNYNDYTKHNINKDIENASSKYYYNSSTVMKYLRKVLNEINHGYMDSGLRTGFIMKRYIEKYKINPERGPKLVLLCLLKDIGLFYQDDYIPKDNHALAAASSFLFLNYCSPLKDDAKPLFYYKAKYIPDIDNDDYKYGLLMTLINQIVMYDYQEYTLDEMEDLLKREKNKYDPEQVRNVIKLLRKEEDILEKLNNKTSLYIYETQNYILQTPFTDEELLGFINTTNFSFEFHNHETLAHTVTVAVIARALAKKSRLPDSMCEEVYLAGLVHDIGKIRVPKEVLCYPGRLEGDMLKEMQRHVTYTKEILEGSFSYKIVEIASNHHEKLDGSGYPRALRAIDLSIGDKIIAVADIASALYCRRSYKASFPAEKIISILESDAEAGKIDKRIVEHLVDNYDEIMGEAKERETIVLKMYAAMKEKYEALKKSNVLYHFFDKNNNNVDAIFENNIKLPKDISKDSTTYGELDKNYVGDEFEVISTNLSIEDEENDTDNSSLDNMEPEKSITLDNSSEEIYLEDDNENVESIEDSNQEDLDASDTEEIETEENINSTEDNSSESESSDTDSYNNDYSEDVKEDDDSLDDEEDDDEESNPFKSPFSKFDPRKMIIPGAKTYSDDEDDDDDE
ncbi:MAG: HD domain-containing protein, partial [Acholeplasmatales bacterium]|nr:HD domain-containing protein [Acholeplasmatales bacterium]